MKKLLLLITTSLLLAACSKVENTQPQVSQPTSTPPVILSVPGPVHLDKFEDKKAGFSITAPTGYWLEKPPDQDSYTISLHKNDEPDENTGILSFNYLNVVRRDYVNDPQRPEVYNYWSYDQISTFEKLKVGESGYERKITDPSDPENKYWQFTRLPNTIVAGKSSAVVENKNLYEGGSPTTRDRRVVFAHKDYYFVLGSYYGSAAELKVFNSLLKNFKLDSP